MQNWRGIMLLSVPSKILTRIILERLKDAIEERHHPEQAGFRKDKSCTDQIATLRIIIEQSLEWQSTLYLNFIDFEKAFDSVDRKVIWKLLQHYGTPPTFINLINNCMTRQHAKSSTMESLLKRLRYRLGLDKAVCCHQ